MGTNNAWDCAFSDRDRDRFIRTVRRRWGPGADTEDVTMRWDFLVKATDVGNADQPKTFDVTSLAARADTAAAATDAQTTSDTGQPDWLSSRTQDPVTGGDSKTTPRSQIICFGGLGIVVNMGLIVCRSTNTVGASSPAQFNPTAAADDAISGIQAAFDACTLELSDGRTRRAEVTGHECASWGSSRVDVMGPAIVATTVSETGVTTTSQVLYSGQMASKDRGWRKIKPTILGADSQLQLKLTVPRSTAWPILADSRFRISVLAPVIMGRMTSAAGACDLGDDIVPDVPYRGVPPPRGAPPRMTTPMPDAR